MRACCVVRSLPYEPVVCATHPGLLRCAGGSAAVPPPGLQHDEPGCETRRAMNASYEGALKKPPFFSGPRVSGGRGVPLTQEGGTARPPSPHRHTGTTWAHTPGVTGAVSTPTHRTPGARCCRRPPVPRHTETTGTTSLGSHRAHVPGEPQGAVSIQTPATQTPVGTRKKCISVSVYYKRT